MTMQPQVFLAVELTRALAQPQPQLAEEAVSAFSAPLNRRSSSPSCSELSPLLPGSFAASQGPTLRRKKAASATLKALSSGFALSLQRRGGIRHKESAAAVRDGMAGAGTG
jgi:hypothetical protein